MAALDASALLAFVHGEPGAEQCEALLVEGGVISAANWSEVKQKILQSQAAWPTVRALLLSYPLAIEPVTVEDAERAAELRSANPQLSLGDRLAIGTAERLDLEIWTSDKAWGTEGRIRQLR